MSSSRAVTTRPRNRRCRPGSRTRRRGARRPSRRRLLHHPHDTEHAGANGMIVVTGAAGFIGSNLVRGLNQSGEDDVVAVDDLSDGDKHRNMASLKLSDYIDKDDLPSALSRTQEAGGCLPPGGVFVDHGARREVHDGEQLRVLQGPARVLPGSRSAVHLRIKRRRIRLGSTTDFARNPSASGRSTSTRIRSWRSTTGFVER